MDEGEIAFAHEPFVRVTAPVMEAQIVETALLAILNFQTSVASKASRVVSAAAGRMVVEFGSRRAHGLEAACLAARAACLADAPRRRTSKPGACSICRSPARWRTRG
jgi:nicotinate phosphoribosyltransferase